MRHHLITKQISKLAALNTLVALWTYAGWSDGPGATCSVTVPRMAWAGPGEASEINLWCTTAFTIFPHVAPLNPSPQLGASVRPLNLQEAPDLGLSPELPFPRQVLILQRKDSPAERVRGRGQGRRRATPACHLSATVLAGLSESHHSLSHRGNKLPSRL